MMALCTNTLNIYTADDVEHLIKLHSRGIGRGLDGDAMAQDMYISITGGDMPQFKDYDVMGGTDVRLVFLDVFCKMTKYLLDNGAKFFDMTQRYSLWLVQYLGRRYAVESNSIEVYRKWLLGDHNAKYIVRTSRRSDSKDIINLLFSRNPLVHCDMPFQF